MIVIQDDMLRDVIARTLHISEEEITEEKLLELKGLSARYAGITSLEGLQHAENLEYLDLCGNSIEILDPIRDLRNIERLNVSKNRLRDLQALHGYRQLKKLDISRTCLRKHSECKPDKTLYIDIHNSMSRTYSNHVFLRLHGKLFRNYHYIIFFRIFYSFLHNFMLQKISFSSAGTTKNKLDCHSPILSPV